MNSVLVLPTERPNLELRQLTIDDAETYFEAVDTSREHLSQYGDSTSLKYPTLESVLSSFDTAKNPDKLRLGIWDDTAFVGSVNATPDDHTGAEIGYWLRESAVGNGYMTLAVKALTQHLKKEFEPVYAHVHVDNAASTSVLERVGYQPIDQIAVDWGLATLFVFPFRRLRN